MNKSKILRIVLIVIIVLLLLFGIFSSWAYYSKPSSFKEKALRAVPYPIALVNWHPITMGQYLQRLEVAQKAYANQTGADASQLPAQTFSRMVTEVETAQVASRYGVSVDSDQLNKAYDQVAAQVQQKDGASMDSLLSLYGLTAQDFKKQVLEPSLLTDNLTLWFNGQEKLNQQQYDKIHNLQLQISQGASFESLVKDNTEDESGKLTEGDLGFVDISQTLPEFQKALAGAKNGDLVFVPSRYGLHLIKIVDRDNNGANGGLRLNARQIFVKGASFDDWFNETAVKNSAVTRLVKFQ